MKTKKIILYRSHEKKLNVYRTYPFPEMTVEPFVAEIPLWMNPRCLHDGRWILTPWKTGMDINKMLREDRYGRPCLVWQEGDRERSLELDVYAVSEEKKEAYISFKAKSEMEESKAFVTSSSGSVVELSIDDIREIAQWYQNVRDMQDINEYMMTSEETYATAVASEDILKRYQEIQEENRQTDDWQGDVERAITEVLEKRRENE